MTAPAKKEGFETYFSPMDRHFADFMVELAGEQSLKDRERLWMAAALVSRRVGQGHVCLSLAEVAGKDLIDEDGTEVASGVCPALDEWVGSLRSQKVVGGPSEFTPLVLDEKWRLYLYRYWLYERQLAGFLNAMVGPYSRPVDTGMLAEGLKRFFPENGQEINWQSVAAALALLNRLTIISGGPGTGKTHTVGRILALIVEQAGNHPVSIALAAPTGKAAARLTDMVRAITEGMDCPEDVKARIPDKAFTIHRLLGPVFGRKTFRYDAWNHLPHDVVVIDEASMVDLPLMAKMVSALKEDSRLILLGDRDQLASVEPGAVFGDICDREKTNGFSGDIVRCMGELLGIEVPRGDSPRRSLGDSIVILQKSYRFTHESGIGLLASAVKERNPSRVLALLKEGARDDIRWRETPSVEGLERVVEDELSEYYGDFLAAEDPEEALVHFARFRVLCALRHGPYGAVALNGLMERVFRRKGVIPKTGRWYKGQPIMVTGNDYQLHLYNGDVGIVFPDLDSGGQLRAYFPAEGGGFRKLLPGRLKECETVYAMTVHKSQGSEFDHVALLLPDGPSRVVTRELIYTAVTRAKKKVEIWGSEKGLRDALLQTVPRESGLKDALCR